MATEDWEMLDVADAVGVPLQHKTPQLLSVCLRPFLKPWKADLPSHNGPRVPGTWHPPEAALNLWLVSVSIQTSQQPGPSGGITEACAQTGSCNFPWDCIPAAPMGSHLNAFFKAAFPSLSCFPISLLCFPSFPKSITCTQILSQLLLQEPKVR